MAARLGSLSPLPCPQQALAPGPVPGSRAPMTNVWGEESVKSLESSTGTSCYRLQRFPREGWSARREWVGGLGMAGPFPSLAVSQPLSRAGKLNPRYPETAHIPLRSPQ